MRFLLEDYQANKLINDLARKENYNEKAVCMAKMAISYYLDKINIIVTDLHNYLIDDSQNSAIDDIFLDFV